MRFSWVYLAGWLAFVPGGVRVASAAESQSANLETASDSSSLWRLSRQPAVVAAGRAVFNQHCVVCHLESMRGKNELPTVVGPDLTDTIWDNGGTPAEIHTTIVGGMPDRGMPPWAEILGPKKITEVVAYIMSKHRKSGPVLAEPGAPSGSWNAGLDEVPFPPGDQWPLVANVSVQLPAGYVMESLCIGYGSRDLILYDLEVCELQSVWTAARLQRNRTELRSLSLEGNETTRRFAVDNSLTLISGQVRQSPTTVQFLGYERLADGVQIRSKVSFEGVSLEGQETLRLVRSGASRRLERALSWRQLPDGSSLEFRTGIPVGLGSKAPQLQANAGKADGTIQKNIWTIRFEPDQKTRTVSATLRYALPDSSVERVVESALPEPHRREDPLDRGSLARPGYRALQYPLPRLSSGEDRVMPYALATDPKTGQLFVASGKLGEVFALRDPTDDGREARMENFGGGLFPESFGMLHDGESLLVMHRRNITRLRDTNGDGQADRFDQVVALPQSPDPAAYDLAYGLVRDKSGSLIVSFAPHGSMDIAGSGGAVRLNDRNETIEVEEVAYGMRNAVGWASGPEGEIFFTDNQGEWVASSRLSHLVPGAYYGFPNPRQRQHVNKPKGPATIWIPYGWGKSVNGVIYDSTGGKFGPFAGQFFLAELMQGGAIIRAQVEKVNGQYQGACFPFWNRGLLGPLTFSFDPKGRLWVGSITEPGWMRQADRGALFRIDFTGEVPFEIESIHARSKGFRLKFTQPPNKRARDVESYRVDHYRYEFWEKYGSREFDRTPVEINTVALHPDGLTVDLNLPGMVKGRVYRIAVEPGVNSRRGEPLVHSEAAYTLNEIPTR